MQQRQQLASTAEKPKLTPLEMCARLKTILTLVANQAVAEFDANQMDEVTVEHLDRLVAKTISLGDLVDELGEITKMLNKTIMKLESKSGYWLKKLEREDYVCPHGSVTVSKKWRVGMPATDEDKLELFAWMETKGIFKRYATVNSRSLQSLFMAEWDAAKKKDPLAEVTFSLPGLPSPVIDEYTEIKAPRGQRSKRKEDDSE